MTLPNLDLAVGTFMVLFPVIIVGLSFLLLQRLRLRGGLEKALVNMILHPNRRRRFLIETSVMSALVVAGLVVAGITLIVPGNWSLEDLALTVVFFGGALTVLGLIADGLANTRLTMDDELTVHDSFPGIAVTIESSSPPSGPSEAEMYVPSVLGGSSSTLTGEGLAGAFGRDPEFPRFESRAGDGRFL